MSTLILYKSKHGATKQYAQWIQEAIQDSSLYSVDDYDFKDIEKYSQVVLASSTYLGEIGIRPYLINNWAKIEHKKVFLLVVGIVFGDDGNIGFSLIPDKIRKHIGYAKVPGKVESKNLNWWEKLIVAITRASDSNQMQKQYIQPVLDYFGIIG